MSRVTGLVAPDLESQHWGGYLVLSSTLLKQMGGGTNMMISVVAEKIFKWIFHEKTSQTWHRRGLPYLITDRN